MALHAHHTAWFNKGLDKRRILGCRVVGTYYMHLLIEERGKRDYKKKKKKKAKTPRAEGTPLLLEKGGGLCAIDSLIAPTPAVARLLDNEHFTHLVRDHPC